MVYAANATFWPELEAYRLSSQARVAKGQRFVMRVPQKETRDRSLSELDSSLRAVERKGLEETDAGGSGVMNQKEETADKGREGQSRVVTQRGRRKEEEELEKQSDEGKLRQHRWGGKRESEALESQSLRTDALEILVL